jgi:hypothetical protein
MAQRPEASERARRPREAEYEQDMKVPVYWLAQAGFVVLVFALIQKFEQLLVLAVLAVLQAIIVSWRLWPSRSLIWIVLVPPVSTFGLGLALEKWAAANPGGDESLFVAVFATMAWSIVSYVVVGVWAGSRRTGKKADRA